MAEALLMIALSPTMTEGSIARWKKKENEAFSSGDLLCEVETDKASMDYEAPKSGVLLKILVLQGAKAEVGQPIAVIGKAGEDPGSLALGTSSEHKDKTAHQAETPPPEKATPSPKLPAKSVQPPSAPAGYPRSSPLARKVALELGIDLRLVRGSGPEGRVTEKDVRSFTASGLASASAQKLEPTSAAQALASRREAVRKTIGAKRAVIAKRLGESFFSAPHYYLRREIKVDTLLDARAEVNKERTSPISFNAVLIKLAASALARHLEMNVYWRGDSIEERKAVDIGLAVALPDGLITPVVRDCDLKGLEQIDLELAALIEKAKSKGLSPEEFEGAGFTISNLGSFGVDEFTAIINPPGSAILAVGAVKKKALVGDADVIEIARTITFTLGCDHRSIDGATGAAFLAELALMAGNPFRALL